MLTQQNIIDKNFTLYKTDNDNILNTYDRDIYLALATKINPDDTTTQFPIQLIYYTNNGLISLKTFYKNPRLTNEYFYAGVALTTEELDILVDTFKYNIEVLDFNNLGTYYE